MTNKQIKTIITNRFRLPVVVLIGFNFIVLISANQTELGDFMEFRINLAFTAINAMLIIALMAHFVSNVLCDINDLNKETSKE